MPATRAWDTGGNHNKGGKDIVDRRDPIAAPKEEEKHSQIKNAIRQLCKNVNEVDRFIDEVESGPAPSGENTGVTEEVPSLATVLDTSAQMINQIASRIPDQLVRLRGLLF